MKTLTKLIILLFVTLFFSCEDVNTNDRPILFTDYPVVDAKSNTAVIKWQISENISATVEYGQTDRYELGTIKSDPKVNGSVAIDGLEINTPYMFRVKVTKQNSEQEFEGTFLTVSDNAFDGGIKDAKQSVNEDKDVTVTGWVTSAGLGYFSNTIMIEDGISGMEVRLDPNGFDATSKFTIGQKVTVTGNVTDRGFGDQPELRVSNESVTIDPDAPIDIVPTEIPLKYLAAFHGRLVTVTDIESIKENPETWSDKKNYTMVSKDAEGVLRVNGHQSKTSDMDGISVGVFPKKLTGIVWAYRGTYQLMPRTKADIE